MNYISDPLVAYREAGLVPLSVWRERMTAGTLLRLKTTNSSTNDELSQDYNNFYSCSNRARRASVPTVMDRTLSMFNYSQRIIKDSNIDVDNLEKDPLPSIPPRDNVTPSMTNTYGDYKKSQEPHILKACALSTIDLYHDYIHIYTDGSKLDDNRVGCAFVAPLSSESGMFRLNNGVSIFTAELYAIQAALEFISNSNHSTKKYLILSDSRSALQALLSEGRNRMQLINQIKNLYLQLTKNNYNISFVWVPSHTGISGNELADKAAGQAAHLPNITTDLGLSLSEAQAALKAQSN
jgi:ribonuclease HI